VRLRSKGRRGVGLKRGGPSSAMVYVYALGRFCNKTQSVPMVQVTRYPPKSQARSLMKRAEGEQGKGCQTHISSVVDAGSQPRGPHGLEEELRCFQAKRCNQVETMRETPGALFSWL
jgi:hypothetical protein